MFKLDQGHRATMSGLNNLNKRLGYAGGNAEGRMQEGKLRALRKALLYSYQAATAVLEDGREFRCLINPDKLNVDLDSKTLSIPFEDICLNKERQGTTSQGMEKIDLKIGDIFTWKETDTHWLVYLQYLEEDAYFRADIRKCKYEVEVDGEYFWAYVRGPVENNLPWDQKNGIYINELNYTAIMYLPNNEKTRKYFQRFTKVKIADLLWEVQAIDAIGVDGIIEVALKETWKNSIEEAHQEEIEQNKPEEPPPNPPYIGNPRLIGDNEVYPYDIKTYFTEDLEGGCWLLSNNKAKIIEQNEYSVTIEITTGRSGNIDLIYKSATYGDVILPIVIKSL